MEKLKLPVKTQLWLYILAIILIGGVAFFGVLWLIMKLGWWLLLVIAGYIVVNEIVGWIAKRLPGKVTRICRSIISSPIAFIYLLVALAHPFITITGTYLLIALFAFGLPALILIGITNLGWIVFKPETIAFIVIALGSVLSSTYSVTKLIIKHSPLKNWGNHDYELHREQLAFYLAHPSNMVFIVYLLYFVLLAVSGYMYIQKGKFLISESFDMAVLKAFLVYIAYTNMRVKARETEVESEKLLQRISGLFVHDKYE